MFWKILKQNKFNFSLILTVFIVFLPLNAIASSGRFLTLPFKQYNNFRLMQGWYYNFGNRAHQGIDYFSNVGTDLLSPESGYATKYYQPGSNFVYGDYVVIDHKNGYKTLYAHLDYINPKIK